MIKDLLNLESDDFWKWWSTRGKNNDFITGMSYIDGKNYSRSFKKRF